MFNIEFNYDTEMSIINEIKNNSIENFRDLLIIILTNTKNHKISGEILNLIMKEM